MAVVLWIIASLAFGLLRGQFQPLQQDLWRLSAGIIAFLVWLWISNAVVLFGAELNAELNGADNWKRVHQAEDELLVTPRVAKNT